MFAHRSPRAVLAPSGELPRYRFHPPGGLSTTREAPPRAAGPEPHMEPGIASGADAIGFRKRHLRAGKRNAADEPVFTSDEFDGRFIQPSVVGHYVSPAIRNWPRDGNWRLKNTVKTRGSVRHAACLHGAPWRVLGRLCVGPGNVRLSDDTLTSTGSPG